MLLIVFTAAVLGMLFVPGRAAASSSTWKIEGTLYNYKTPSVTVSNVHVWASWWGFGAFLLTGFKQNPVTTDGTGHFVFTGQGIYANSLYYLSVNGPPASLGTTNDDNSWGQYFVGIKTNSQGYALQNLYVDSAPQVRAPQAALYSNTLDASIFFNTNTANTMSNTLSFMVSNTGIQNGYASSISENILYQPAPLTQIYVYQNSYANTFYCAADPNNGCTNLMGGTGILKTGVSAIVPGSYASTDYTTETLSPSIVNANNPTSTFTQGSFNPSWTMSQSSQFSKSLGFSFGIEYSSFGTTIDLTTVTSYSSTTTHTIGATINNNQAYTKTYMFYPLFLVSNQYIAGAELHVWDVTPPLTPSLPGGPNYIQYNTIGTYWSVATDPEGRALQYKFSWGDGTSTTTGWYSSGATAYASHSWGGAGVFYVKVQAYNGVAWSAWSPSLAVTVQYGQCPPHCSPTP